MTDLGTLGGNTSEAFGINASGDVVGESYLSDDATMHAFLYSHGKMTDIGSLPGASFTVAKAINDRGQIVGDWVTTPSSTTGAR